MNTKKKKRKEKKKKEESSKSGKMNCGQMSFGGGGRAGDLIQVKGIMKKEQSQLIFAKTYSGLHITGKKFTYQQVAHSAGVV